MARGFGDASRLRLPRREFLVVRRLVPMHAGIKASSSRFQPESPAKKKWRAKQPRKSESTPIMAFPEAANRTHQGAEAPFLATTEARELLHLTPSPGSSVAPLLPRGFARRGKRRRAHPHCQMASSTQPFGNVLDWKTLGAIIHSGIRTPEC